MGPINVSLYFDSVSQLTSAQGRYLGVELFGVERIVEAKDVVAVGRGGDERRRGGEARRRRRAVERRRRRQQVADVHRQRQSADDARRKVAETSTVGVQRPRCRPLLLSLCLPITVHACAT